ncbi:hypothetical protein ElyMa_006136400 [Elysia marginata]|uniref:Uncharacterized protein n=1 Tax=Elysia marginata TaxID=1093978 RepID=A0AAV4GX94_9GAST|nr:hypothetical protein ElyMa_006136400 [Elysia marginata]
MVLLVACFTQEAWFKSRIFSSTGSIRSSHAQSPDSLSHPNYDTGSTMSPSLPPPPPTAYPHLTSYLPPSIHPSLNCHQLFHSHIKALWGSASLLVSCFWNCEYKSKCTLLQPRG